VTDLGDLRSTAEVFIAELTRTVDRLNSMSLARLDQADASGETPAARAHALCGLLVDLRSALTGESAPSLPRLRAHGAGSQLAVVGNDLLEAVQSVGADSFGLASPTPAQATLTAAAAHLRELRRPL
jgi:hypothetical protein